MKPYKFTLLLLMGSFAFISAASQNAVINILSQNSGTVRKGETVFLEVTVNNTDPFSNIGYYKIKALINVPSEIVSIDTTGLQLPAGWTFMVNNGSSIVLSNGTDIIASNTARTLMIPL
ncbi:MAG TPA: hypothetical protein VFI06_14710, partial [Chitinophagaceae bacterium]|nr:hypothetical protein [Chitinophagaceae bacterium]